MRKPPGRKPLVLAPENVWHEWNKRLRECIRTQDGFLKAEWKIAEERSEKQKELDRMRNRYDVDLQDGACSSEMRKKQTTAAASEGFKHLAE
jgi:hypothetical protein